MRGTTTPPRTCRGGSGWSAATSGTRSIAARAREAAAGFAELAYAVLGEDTLPAVGAVRHDGPPAPLPPGRLFTFRR